MGYCLACGVMWRPRMVPKQRTRENDMPCSSKRIRHLQRLQLPAKADHNPQVRPRKAVGQGTSFGFGYDSLPRRLWKTNLSRRDGMSRNKVFCDSADVCPTGLDQPDDV